MEKMRFYNARAWIILIAHRCYNTFLWSMIFLLLFVMFSDKTIVDREVATAITNGCAYYDDVLYIKEGEFISPELVAVGDPRDLIPGFSSVPSFITLRHWTGWFSWREVIIYSLKSVRCVLTQVRDI